jgi:hypothetical protein
MARGRQEHVDGWSGKAHCTPLHRCLEKTRIEHPLANKPQQAHTQTHEFERHLRARRLRTLLHSSAHWAFKRAEVGNTNFPFPVYIFASPKLAYLRSNITTTNHHITSTNHPHIIKMEYNTGAPAQGMTGGRACYNCESHPHIPSPTALRRSTAVRTLQSLCGCYNRHFRIASEAGHAHESFT